MKLAIPADDDKKSVCPAFGRAPLFALCDCDSGELSFFENPAAEVQGGAGIKAAQAVLDSGASVLLTVRLGENSAEILKAADFEIYQTTGTSIEENIKAYLAGTLSPLTHFHAGYHGIQ